MQNIAVSPLSRKDIRAYAWYLRLQFGMDKSPYIALEALLEVLCCPISDREEPLVNLDIVDDDELPEEYAAYYPQHNLLKIRQSVYLGACNGNGRDRFTIAHELGHFFLHRHAEVILSRYDSKTEEIPAYCNPEWQANTFASEFLIPYCMVQGMTPQEVSKACGTSLEASRIALKQQKSRTVRSSSAF